MYRPQDRGLEEETMIWCIFLPKKKAIRIVSQEVVCRGLPAFTLYPKLKIIDLLNYKQIRNPFDDKQKFYLL